MDNKPAAPRAQLDNPIIIAIIAALRLLGCVTQQHVGALLGVVTVDLTVRERDAVLDAFPDGCPGQHLPPACGPACQDRTPEPYTAAATSARPYHTLLLTFRLLGFDPSWLEYPLYIGDDGVRCDDAGCACDAGPIDSGVHCMTTRQLVQAIAEHREEHGAAAAQDQA